MPHPNHTITISDIGVQSPTVAQPGDTVQWQAESNANEVYGVVSATITFPGSNPLEPHFSGGSLTLSGGENSSLYTVATTAKPGNYSYKVAVAGGKTYTPEIQVLSSNTIVLDPD